MKNKVVSVLLVVLMCFTSLACPFLVSFADEIGDFFYQVWRKKFVDNTPIVRFLNFVSEKEYDEKKWGYLNVLREVFHDSPLDRDTLSNVLGGMWLPGVKFCESEIKAMLGDFEYVDELYSTIQPIVNELLTVGNYHVSIDDILDYVLMGRTTGFTDDGAPQIPAEDFVAEIIKQNNTIAPKNPNMVKYSWRDLSPVQENADFGRYARCVYTDGKSVVGTNLEEGIYVQPYAIRSGYIYYTPYQYHLYRKLLPTTVQQPLNDGSGNYVYLNQYSWKMDCIYYECFEDGESIDTFTVDLGITADRYEGGKILSGGFENMSMGTDCSIGWTDFYGFPILGYETRGNCFKNVSYISNLYCGGQINIDNRVSSHFKSSGGFYLRSDDVSEKISEQSVRPHFIYGAGGFWNGALTINDHDLNSCDDTVKHTCDAGLYVSATSFSIKYAFDTTRISSNSTVTVSGDSVYDYSITDNTTGDTTTIYNYVNNNYNYPPKDDTSEPSTSETSKPTTDTNSGSGNVGGTIGGNVNVGGAVKVDGQINVSIPDINININQNQIGGDGSINSDYSMPDMTTMDDYLEDALDDSSGFRKFLKEFFDFLPPPILALLGVALTCAIIARLCGR